MADITINDLAEVTTIASGDFVAIWRTANGDTRKITRANLYGGLLTGGGTIATGGYTLTVPKTGTAVVGSGTSGRVASFSDTNTVAASTLAKSGAGVLTLSAASAYTLTVPATGTAALLDAAQTLTNKTLTTPTISGTGFTNAQHAHTGASSGGELTQYVALAGRSGGQTAYGGTGSGESLTLSSTSHPTKGKIYASDSIVLPLDAFIQVTDSGATDRSIFGTESSDNSVSFFNNLNGDGGPIRIRTKSGGGESARFDADGFFGLGTTSPQGQIHAHDGTGGFLFVTKTGIVGSAVTIIPNGTGDVVRYVLIKGVYYNTNGDKGSFEIGLAPGETADIEGHTLPDTRDLTLALAANGALTAQRSSGSDTWSIAVTCTWL